MDREKLREKLNEVEQSVKWKRPDDTMRIKYGLPDKDIVVHAKPFEQLTLDEWFYLEESVSLVDEIVKLVLAELPV